MRRIASDLLFQVINLRYEQGNMIEFPDKLICPHGLKAAFDFSHLTWIGEGTAMATGLSISV